MSGLDELNRLPVPMPGLVRSVRVLSLGDLGSVSGAVAWYADQIATNAATSTPYAWAERVPALLCYGAACSYEALERAGGGSDVLRKLCLNTTRLVGIAWEEALRRGGTGRLRRGKEWKDPSWMGLTELHARHRSALLRGEDREWYAARGWRDQTHLEGDAGVDLQLPASLVGQAGARWWMEPKRDWPGIDQDLWRSTEQRR